MLLCEHVCPVSWRTHLAGDKSDDMKHFEGVTTPVDPTLHVLHKYTRKLFVVSLKNMSFDSAATRFLSHQMLFL